MAASADSATVLDVGEALHQLESLTPMTEEYDSAVSRVLGSEQNVNLIKENCVDGDVSQLDRAQTIKLVAELAKAESARDKLCKVGIIPSLVASINSENREIGLQSIRALGNLCYEQDTCREEVLKCGGLVKLQELMAFCVEKHDSFIHLKTACCGCLHNLLNGNEDCQRAAIGTDIVTLIKNMMELNANHASICSFCYMALSSIAEIEEARKLIYTSGVIHTLLKLFVNTNIKDTDELLINLISSLTDDSDKVKQLLADSSVDMHLLSIISLLSSSADEDDQTLVKAASELLVLVLTGDEAMKVWFDNGNGLVFTSVCEWLHGTNGQLLQSAAFALGNFARDDVNSNIIIQRQVSLELFRCLDQLQSFRDDARTAPTIHAILSALRNLAIAPNSKRQLLQQGIMTHLTPYIGCDNTIVTSKLISVMRLLIDKNEAEASSLGRNKTLVERLVRFGHTDSNMLLKGESTRCLAWIVKNSREAVVLCNALTAGTVPHLLFLVKSEHAVMQNEGLISLILLTSLTPEEAKHHIGVTDLMACAKDVISRNDPPIAEVMQNMLVLINQCITIGLVGESVEPEVSELLNKLADKYQEETIANLLKSIRIGIENKS